ncbi:MAG: sigma-70 family RNA polymerase sigma factor [Acidobacteriota bacterium]
MALLEMDADLVAAYRQGDARAFEQLVQRYERPLFTYILRMLGNREDAEDVFQDTVRRILEHMESYEERGKFGSWLFRIAHRLCADRARRSARWRPLLSRKIRAEDSDRAREWADPSPGPDEVLEEKELMDLIACALRRLPPRQREVFLLREHSGLRFREISEIVGRPLNTVLGQMRLATLAVRAALGERTR